MSENIFDFAAFGGKKLSLMLFKDVKNSDKLLSLLQSGTLEPELALFNADLVPGTFPVLAAAYKALSAQDKDGLVTRTLHSELVYNYAASKHISESLRRCGVGEKTRRVLVGRFDLSDADVENIRALIKGEEVGLGDLQKSADLAAIRKHFKVTSVELEVSTLEDALVCRIAARDAL